ncbi:MAG: ribosome recycling factor [Bacillota bacterium]|jgi:ribosome recycling factor
MIKDVLSDAQVRMDKVAQVLSKEFSSLRAGRANPAILDKVLVDYYGTPTAINQTSNISCPEPRLILIQPWDKNTVPIIEKAILKSDLGLTPHSDGSVIRINIPPLTEERRKELVKVCNKKTEEAKVAIRNIRRDLNDMIKDLEKSKSVSEDESVRGLDEIQKITNKSIKKLEEILEQKEKEIMEI